MRRSWLGPVAAVVLVAGCGGAAAAVTAGTSSGYATTPSSGGLVNPAAVPLGDGYVSPTPKVGYVDSCITHFGGGGGAQLVGPWINQTAKTWDLRTKLAVSGSVSWPGASYKLAIAGNKRVITFNDLPINHTTGVFPIAQSDPASQYDRNPNHIASHQLSWSLPLHPKLASTPSCTPGGAIGVLKDGVVLYNALDGQGRDAGAHEVLDRCAGHPDMASIYHHHDVPPCILASAPNGKATLVGYALDGFGIYVVKSSRGTLPGNRSLDACHGTTSKVPWNGSLQRIYHYVATLEYPYTVGCYSGRPLSIGHVVGPPPGAPAP